MDHNGFYADLDSLSSLTNSIGVNSFSDTTCPTLPSLNNFKYQQSTSNIYQQQTIPDLNQPQNHSTKSTSVSSLSSSTLPPTQININNCNNNIFFPPDDALFVDPNLPPCGINASRNNPTYNSKSIPSGGSSVTIGGTSGIGSGSSDSNITYNINNINTNIVNNINNPTNLVNSSDIFGGNQYHQINKNGETIINFTNNNLNATAASMPTELVQATSSQNFFGYQANSAAGQVYETQSNSSSTLLDMSAMTKNPSQNQPPPPTAVYHHLHHPNSHQNNQTMTNGASSGAYHQSGNAIITDLTSGTDYSGSISAAKVINNFESKNPVKYSTAQVPVANRNGQTGYYKNEFPAQYHGYNMYPPNSGMKPGYEIHGHVPPSRMTQRTHFPGNPPYFVDEHHNRSYYAPRAAPYPHPAPPPHTIPHHHPHQYGNYYPNSYNHVMPPYSPNYPHQMPYAATSTQLRNDTCSKTTPNYSKTGAMAMSPVEHSTFPLPSPAYPKNFTDNPYYYELSPCSKKTKSDNYYGDHHHMLQNGNIMRNSNYQPAMPKPPHYNNGSGYPMLSDGLNSCDYQSYNCRYKNGDISAAAKVAKASPMMSTKQFRTYNNFEPPHPPTHYPYAATNAPQYHTMQVKHPSDKIKISIDLEEQINSSKIPKMREPTAYGYDLHYPTYYPYSRASRGPSSSLESDKIANINISLRDFLSTWNEIDEEDESRPSQNGMVLEDLNEHIERTIMREYNPMFVQKATDNLITNGVENCIAEKPSQMDTINADGTEKLYVLETIDVPISELNKYKHLNVINKLPENVVIDKELFTDMDLNREKLYKSEFELEFEACQERKISKEDENIPTVEVKSSESEAEEEKEIKKEVELVEEKSVTPVVRKKPQKSNKVEKVPKIKQSILKLKKEKILKASKDPRKTTRITKRARKYSLNQKNNNVKNLQSICVDFLNTSHYRNYAREQLSISKKFSKMKVFKDLKKKFNFEGMKKPPISQKIANSMRKNASFKVLTLKNLCTKLLSSMNVSVVDLFTPPTLKELCESFIYSNRQFFHIEELPAVPKLQELCKDTLSATNIFINIDDDTNNIYALNESASGSNSSGNDEPIYIVEENSGSVGELFESDTLNPHEKSELLRKIQRATATIDDDDEIIRAIGALHENDDDDNNNSSNLYNRNFIDDVTDYLDVDDDLFQSVQYEEIISGNSRGEKMKKIVEILRHKYLNRSDVRQACRTIHRIMHKCLDYQRVRKFHNARRKERINELLQQARSAMQRMRNSLNCDKGELMACKDYSDNDDIVMVEDEVVVVVKEAINVIAIESHSNKIMAEQSPKLPFAFPSINEYKIEQKVNGRSDELSELKKRKMSFEESLMNINKIYTKSDDHRRHKSRRSDERHKRRRSRSRHRRDRESSRKSSNRHDHYRKDENHVRHSETRRLIIPSYKLYDKDLDVKLKVRPYVRIEREERVDDLVKKVQLN